MTKRSIRTNREDVDCSVCERTLLRGEHAEVFIGGGVPRLVCELCTVRAQHEGWIRQEAVLDESSSTRRNRRENRRNSIMDRWRSSRRRPGEEQRPQTGSIQDTTDDPALGLEFSTSSSADDQAPSAAYRERQIRAVPASPELKMQRAIELFNGSEHSRTIAGVARSLGSPEVSVQLRPDEPSVVVLTIMWELSWYRFEVDLADQNTEVRCESQGYELADLGEEKLETNASANDRGLLKLEAKVRSR